MCVLCGLTIGSRPCRVSFFHTTISEFYIFCMRCSAGFMFGNAVVDSCSTCIRKSMFSLMSRFNMSTNVIVQSTLNCDVYTTSELYQRWAKALYT